MADCIGTTRERVKRVALELFASQGYAETSLREIAERMEFTKAALYYHFRNKDDLLAELVDPLLEDLDRLIADTPGLTVGLEARRALLGRLVTVLLAHRRLAPLVFANPLVLGKSGIGDRVRARIQRLIESLAGPEPGVAERIRAHNAVGVMRAVFVFHEADETLLHDELVAQATAILEAPLQEWST
ncbi:MAG: TetR/AcrR family transcriptional regulator [Egibacteraceae bacterium]